MDGAEDGTGDVWGLGEDEEVAAECALEEDGSVDFGSVDAVVVEAEEVKESSGGVAC